VITRIEYGAEYLFLGEIVRAIDPDMRDSFRCNIEFPDGERYSLTKEYFCDNAEKLNGD
jgi:hypothetical protein